MGDLDVGHRRFPRLSAIEKIAKVPVDPIGMARAGVFFDDFAVVVDFPAIFEATSVASVP